MTALVTFCAMLFTANLLVAGIKSCRHPSVPDRGRCAVCLFCTAESAAHAPGTGEHVEVFTRLALS